MENFNWQINLCSVRERTEYAFKKALYCDVKLSVPDSNETEFSMSTTKYMLAVTSPVFAAMFYGQLAETNSTIELQDCTKEGLQEFLRYVHSDQVCLTPTNVIDVIYIAEKYIVPPLVKKCMEYIEKELKPDDIFTVLNKVSLIFDNSLEQHCWNVVSEETQRAVSSEPFLDIPYELLCQVLLSNKLAIKEISLFQAVDRWVSKRIQENGCENSGKVKRIILEEDAIRLIRFPLMTQKEFAQIVLPSRVLKMQEVTELVQYFSDLPPETRLFSTKERDGTEHLLMAANRFESVGPFTYNGLQASGIDFQVNKTINLVGARLFGSESSSFEVDFSIHEIQEQTGKYKSKCHFISTVEAEADKTDELYYALDVFLKTPIQLIPGSQYKMGFRMKGRHECVGCGGKTEAVTCQDIKVTYKNPTLGFNQHFRGSEPEGGQMQTLIFKRM